MADDVTLSGGGFSVTLSAILHDTILPTRRKVFSENVLSDGSKSVDEAEQVKRTWLLKQETSITTSEMEDLDSLYEDVKFVTFTEDWIEPGTFTCHFRSFTKKLTSHSGSPITITLELVEL